MEWRPAGWSVCLSLLIFPCTIKSRSPLLAPAHLGGRRKRAVKWLCVYYRFAAKSANETLRPFAVSYSGSFANAD